MSITADPRTDGRSDREHAPVRESRVRRLSTETKASFKTTEFFAFIAVLVGIVVAGALTKAAHYGGDHDIFRADKVWLYATILTAGYMISRGLAKSGSRQPYDEDNS